MLCSYQSINNAFIRDKSQERGDDIMNALVLSIMGIVVVLALAGLGMMLYDKVKYGQG